MPHRNLPARTLTTRKPPITTNRPKIPYQLSPPGITAIGAATVDEDLPDLERAVQALARSLENQGRTLQHNLTGRHESANASRAHSCRSGRPGIAPESPDSPGRFIPAPRRYCGCAASHPQGAWRERCVKAGYGPSWKREGLRRLGRDAPWPENGGAGSWTHQQFSSARRTR